MRRNTAQTAQIKATTPLPTLTVDEVLGEGGLLSKCFDGYQVRPEQLLFSNAARKPMAEKGILLAEAPTGTGKSLGYLVPAILEAKRSGSHVVVATANIALQEQLVTKDLPLLQRELAKAGVEFTFAIAKGFSNYACKWRLGDADSERLMGKRLYSGADQEQLEKVLEWSAETQKGDVSELPFELAPAVRRLTVIPSDECLGKKCAHYNDCFPRAARRSYAGADVVVTNYHLYFLDLKMKIASGQPAALLPEHSILVCDEAHNVAEIARSFLGERVSSGSVKTATEDLDAKGSRAERLELPPRVDPDLMRRTRETAEDLFAGLAELKRSKTYGARLDRPRMFDPSALVRDLEACAKRYVQAASDPGCSADARAWLLGRSDLCKKQAALLAEGAALEDSENVYYLDEQGRGSNVALVREPLEPSKLLRPELWEKDQNPRSFVLCSATLTTGGKRGFKFVAEQLGIEQYETLAVESPFDYGRAIFCVPTGLVPDDPKSPAFQDSAARVLIETVRAAGGRTLALFTSYRNLEAMHGALVRAGLGYRVMRQGEAPRTELVRRFKEDETSVLLGTDSFWEGVDVPGRALTALFIDKIPFKNFQDPILDAIKDRDEDWFGRYYLPDAVITFKQGVGRLIRSVEDYGAIVCCDARVIKKGYGASFRNAVPEAAKRTKELADVGAFLSQFGVSG